MANVSPATGLLYAFGGALSGLGQGMEKSGILDREEALKRLEIIAANARADKEIGSREKISQNEITAAGERNAATETGANQRNTATIAAEGQRTTQMIGSEDARAAAAQAAETAREKDRSATEALIHPIKLSDGTMALTVPDGKGGVKSVPITDKDGNPVKGLKSADDAIDQMRVYSAAVKTYTTKNDDGTAATDWGAVSDALNKLGPAYKDLAESAQAEGAAKPFNQDLWDQTKMKWAKKADQKAGYFSTDKTDFPETGGDREAWTNLKALQEYRAKGGKGLPDELKGDAIGSSDAPPPGSDDTAAAAAARGAPAPGAPAAGGAAAPGAPAAGAGQVDPNTFKTDADVRAAYRAGQIDKATATKLLQTKFGYQ
jgi:hypothetical protein